MLQTDTRHKQLFYGRVDFLIRACNQNAFFRIIDHRFCISDKVEALRIYKNHERNKTKCLFTPVWKEGA